MTTTHTAPARIGQYEMELSERYEENADRARAAGRVAEAKRWESLADAEYQRGKGKRAVYYRAATR